MYNLKYLKDNKEEIIRVYNYKNYYYIYTIGKSNNKIRNGRYSDKYEFLWRMTKENGDIICVDDVDIILTTEGRPEDLKLVDSSVLGQYI